MWYIAEVVQEITVEGEADNVIHINTVLLQADDDEAAYRAALEQAYDDRYENPDGKQVRFRFRGLRELFRIYDEVLEHGTELFYEEKIGVSESDVSALVSDRNDLAIFREPEITRRPNYSSREILDEAQKRIDRSAGLGGDGAS